MDNSGNHCKYILTSRALHFSASTRFLTPSLPQFTQSHSLLRHLHFPHLSLSRSLSNEQNEVPLYHLPLSPCLVRSVVPRSQHNKDPGQAPGVLHLQPLPECHTPCRRDQPPAHDNLSGREQWRHGTVPCARPLIADDAACAFPPCFG
jgi:hypothetical protein